MNIRISNRSLLLIISLFMLLNVSACGKKGPLYIDNSAQKQAAQDDKNKKKDQ